MDGFVTAALPTLGIVLGVLFACGILALIVAALVQISGSMALDGTARAVWILIVVVAPVIGAIIWFTFGPDPVHRSSR